MRIRTALLVLVFLAAPFSVDAAGPTTCAGGNPGDPSGSKTFKVSAKIAEEVNAYLKQAVCANACFDENIGFSVSLQDLSLNVAIQTTNKCAKTAADPKGLDPSKNNRGCTKGQTTPSAVIKTPAIDVPFVLKIASRTIGPKNRCDTALLKNVDSMTKALAGGGVPSEENVNLALDELDKNTSGPSTGSLSSGTNQALSDALQDKLGLDSSEADGLVANNRNTAEELLRLYEDDPSKLAEAAKAANVELSDDVLGKIARLAPEERGGEEGGTLGDTSERNFSSTGFESVAGGELTLDAKGQPSAPVGPGNKINSDVLGAIAADAQRKVCGSVRGTCYVTTEAQFGTMMNETPGNTRDIGDGGKSMSLAQVYEPTARDLLDDYRSLYGEEYLLNNINIEDPSLNPEWVASQSLRMQALVLQQKGNQTGGNFGRLLSAYNGGGSAAAAYGVKALNNVNLLQNGNAAGYWQNAYDAARDAVASGPTITNLSDNVATTPPRSFSPFGNVSPFGGGSESSGNPLDALFSSFFGGGGQGAGNSADSSEPAASSDGGGGTSAPPQQNAPIPVSQQIVQPVPGSAGQNALPPSVAPVATLFVQQKEVQRGNPVSVSWSTLGTSGAAPCKVFLRAGGSESVVAEGNEGTKRIETTATMSAATWDFRLECTSQSGVSLQQTASVLVQ